ncbi:MAG: hypothetical protein A2506_09890, partial [Elusimicrobia bacterium RIFOXYD12_FULL_66_9]
MGLRAYDVSEWGFFRFSGPDAKTFLQGLVTADVRKLSTAVMLPSCVLTPKGLMVADCELYEETEMSVLVVTRPAAAVGLLKAFEKKVMLSKSAMRVLSGRAWLVIGDDGSRGLPWTRLQEPARLLIGADPPEEAEILSEPEFEVLRVASGLPWFGADMDDSTLPLEARQEAAISLEKGCYMGQETVSRIVHMGQVRKILMGLRLSEGRASVDSVVLRDGREVGKVTSSAGGLSLAMI